MIERTLRCVPYAETCSRHADKVAQRSRQLFQGVQTPQAGTDFNCSVYVLDVSILYLSHLLCTPHLTKANDIRKMLLENSLECTFDPPIVGDMTHRQ